LSTNAAEHVASCVWQGMILANASFTARSASDMPVVKYASRLTALTNDAATLVVNPFMDTSGGMAVVSGLAIWSRSTIVRWYSLSVSCRMKRGLGDSTSGPPPVVVPPPVVDPPPVVVPPAGPLGPAPGSPNTPFGSEISPVQAELASAARRTSRSTARLRNRAMLVQ
jgi:hypothetical protein